MPNDSLPLEELLIKLSDDPENAELRFLVGRAYLEEMDSVSALKHLLASARQEPENWRTLEYLGCAYIAHGDFEKAAWAFTETCRLLPDDPYDALFLASARLLCGDKELGFVIQAKHQGTWPYPIAAFIRGEISIGALLAYASAETDDEDRMAYETEAHFYAGIRCLSEGDINEMHEHFVDCKDMSTYEGIMARGLLKLSDSDSSG